MTQEEREQLISKFEPQLSDITNPWGNALYKHAIGYNPNINLESPVIDKINCLPEAMQGAFLLTVSKIDGVLSC